MAITAQNLIDEARQRADFVGSVYLTDSTELLTWCRESYKELWDLLVECYGEHYFLTTLPLTVSTNPTPSGVNILKLIRVDRAVDDIRVPIHQFDITDAILDDTARSWATTEVFFNLEGDSLRWHPTPDATETVKLYYVPQATLAALATAIAAVAEPWAHYIVIDLAIKMRTKEESDTSDLKLEKEAFRRRIVTAGTPRTLTRAQRTVDVRSHDEDFMGLYEDILP